jgi:Pyruvate/2-oxoacid:ferredoxin oxidoreductase delta subunit
MDAVVGLDRDGPAANGEPRSTGLLLASESAPALDIIACRIIGIDPDRVPAVREAVTRGLVNENAITVHGRLPSVPYVTLPDVEQKKKLMKKLDDYVFEQFIVVPIIHPKQCTRCNACIGGCPTGAIRYDSDSMPVIDYKTCIYCYCCESCCTHEAISLSGSALNRVIRAARYIMKL